MKERIFEALHFSKIDIENIEEEEESDAYINEYHQNAECEPCSFRAIGLIVFVPCHNF